MILGEERPVSKFVKYVGVGEFNVLGFNFDRQTIVAKCGYDPGKDQEYTRKVILNGGKEVNSVNITAFVKEVTTGTIMRLGFLMKETDDVAMSGNIKYVNAKCQNTYTLMDWFTEQEHRKAYIGEADFLHFMRNWLSNFNWFEKGPSGARYPLKENIRLFGGNFNALNDLSKKYTQQTVGILCGIRDSDKGQKQDMCNRAFVPGYQVSRLSELSTGMNASIIATLPYAIKDFVNKVEGEYGYKNFYGNSYKFREYNATDNILSGNNNAIVNSSSVDDLSY